MTNSERQNISEPFSFDLLKVWKTGTRLSVLLLATSIIAHAQVR